jgi:hypothetical protein
MGPNRQRAGRRAHRRDLVEMGQVRGIWPNRGFSVFFFSFLFLFYYFFLYSKFKFFELHELQLYFDIYLFAILFPLIEYAQRRENQIIPNTFLYEYLYFLCFIFFLTQILGLYR